jgi:hypothetical protein
MLDETLHEFPDRFRAMMVRIGQIAGARGSGYWNQVEHFAFMVKSAQTLRVLPVFGGGGGVSVVFLNVSLAFSKGNREGPFTDLCFLRNTGTYRSALSMT